MTATEKQIKFLYGKGKELGFPKDVLDKTAEEMAKMTVEEASAHLKDLFGEKGAQDATVNKDTTISRDTQIFRSMVIKIAVECAWHDEDWQGSDVNDRITLSKQYYDKLIATFKTEVM